jgi:hypothetical protein
LLVVEVGHRRSTIASLDEGETIFAMVGIEGGLMVAAGKRKRAVRWRLSRVNREASNRGENRSAKSRNWTIAKLTPRS